MKFKLWCIEHGFTQKKVADVVGISFASVAAYWQEIRKPSRATEKKMKEVLGIPSGLFD